MSEKLFAGRYRLEGRLGSGGMSTVQSAFDTRLERRVAVKLLAEHLADDPDFVSRFRREALAAGRLVHPNIVQVFDFGLDDETGQHYIVMEVVAGRSCAELLRDHTKLPLDQGLDILKQACDGLEHAHRNGLVHRDVKPGNLLVSDHGVVKLADFGIAKAAEESSITKVGSVLGTAAYLSPEQARGEEAGPQADLYGLGVVGYQLLSGRLPYEAASLSELAYKQQNERPVPLDSVNPEIPGAVARALERALALSPTARYESAKAMGDALRAAEEGIAPPAPETAQETAATHILGATEATRALPPRQPRVPRPPRPGPPTGPITTAPPPAPPRRRSGARRTLRVLLVLALLGGGGGAAAAIIVNELNKPHLRSVNYDNTQTLVNELRGLVDDNTR